MDRFRQWNGTYVEFRKRVSTSNKTEHTNLPKMMMKRCWRFFDVHIHFDIILPFHTYITRTFTYYNRNWYNESIRQVHISVFIAVAQQPILCSFAHSLLCKIQFTNAWTHRHQTKGSDQPLLPGVKRVIHLNRRHFFYAYMKILWF